MKVCNNDREFKYEECFNSCLIESIQNKDGRLQWKCEMCKKYQHPDHEMMRSHYYQFSGCDGPYFCGYHCLMKYRDMNDVYRFANVEQIQNVKEKRRTTQKRRTWTVSNMMDRATHKQKENILKAIHAQVAVNDDNNDEVEESADVVNENKVEE